MGETNEVDNELMLPGFRFHPTDEELISFYLKRKIQQRPLFIELIKQLDIYKYDPWDLPKFAITGEKEWYFYCPRDRKYRNSTRPNRVTGAGFWKATGTDRPIYSSEGTNCIGLKKSLVYYKGRAAKGIKTDWMMHEFRLPSITDSTSSKRPLEKNLPTNDSWAICRIFKKTCSMAQRALAHSWVSPISENSGLDPYTHTEQGTQFVMEDISCTSEAGSSIMFSCNNDLQKSASNFPSIDIPMHKAINPTTCKPPLFPISGMEFPTSIIFSPPEMMRQTKCTVNHPSMPQNLSPSTSGDVSRASMNIDFGLQQCNGYAVSLQQEIKGNVDDEKEACLRRNNEHNPLEITTTVNVPFNLPPNLSDEWKSNFPWDSPPYPSEISMTYSTANCYT